MLGYLFDYTEGPAASGALALRETLAESADLPKPLKTITLPDIDSAREYARHSKAENTLRGLRTGWRIFREWCESRGLPALPATPETVAAFIAHLADSGRKPGTISQRLSCIAKAHQAAGFDSPCSMRHIAVSETLKGIRRLKGVKPLRKSPVLVEDLRHIMAAIPAGVLGTRDAALLLLGFSGALRRSELVGLDVPDIRFTDDGLILSLRRSKTDQEGAGTEVGIPFGSNRETCPVRSMRAWLAASEVIDGSVFRAIDRHGNISSKRLSGFAVAIVVKRRLARIGLDASLYSAHSLRAGLATCAAVAGVPDRIIMKQTRHASVAMLSVYVRPAGLFRENAAARIGL